jgi:calcium-translocating P-type ATPase
LKAYGLSSAKAQEIKEKYGDNRLTEHETEGFWSKFRANLGDPMIKILCVALAINVVFAFLGQTAWYESAGIALAVLLATFVSTFSEYRNESAFQKLQAEAAKIVCKVYRDGEITEISINDIVAGDCVLLQGGDKVPADGALLAGELQVDQSVLNGETKEARKIALPDGAPLPDGAVDFLDEYSLFRGAVVCGGHAVMSAVTVGDNSVYGKIAGELQQEDDRDTPLKLKLKSLAGDISKFGYIGGVLIAVALLFQNIVIRNGFDPGAIAAYCSNWMAVANDFVQALMLAVIIIVMAVPEGLPLMIAIVSALNMGKMLKDNVLVRKVAGIETAGSLNILFSDKTGTITRGQLETVIFIDGKSNEYISFAQIPGKLQKLLALNIRHNTGAVLTGSGRQAKVIGGNATERAILNFAAGEDGPAAATVTDVIPFNSKNKYSAARVRGDYELTLLKGAPEKLLPRCRCYYDESGVRQAFDGREELDAKIDRLASRAIRVLALAAADEKIEAGRLPSGDWTLIGIVGIRDEVRAESAAAIRDVQNAGVQVVMITGDRKDTAVAIARETGLLLDGAANTVLTSDELAQLSDENLKNRLKDIRVIARALPSDKSRLVRAAQELNMVTGMTGDGVNDAPALKAADVGFAMGSGTEVAKEAAEIIILDDNFSSIGKAVLYGRTIFNSIRKFIIFQLTINVAAVLVSFVSPLLGMKNPLSITQILWVNLVMDTLAALAFGGEPALGRFMQEAPKRRDENIVSNYMWGTVFTGSILTFVLSMFFLLSDFSRGVFRPDAENKYLLTGYFAFFIFTAVFNAFNARTDRLNLFDNIGLNRGFLRIMCLIAAVQVAMTYLGGLILRCFGLNGREWLFVLLLALIIIPVDLARKFAFSRR